MKPGLHQLAQSAATDGQIPAWDGAAGLWVPVDPTGLADPTTTAGDLLVRDASAIARQAIGTNGQVLTVDTSLAKKIKWATPTAETLPVTIIDAKGDLIVGTANDTAARKAVGTDGQVLTADAASGGGIKWATPSSGFADPLTTKGDLIGRDASATGRLAVGSDGQVLTADAASTKGIKWSTPATGLTDPTTTKGDLLARSASAVARLAVGADGTSLVADAAQTLGVKYENRVKSIVQGSNITVDNTDPLNPVVAGVPTANPRNPLDPASLHATYGDHFTGGSLDAKWTRVGYIAGDEQYAQGGGTWLQIDAGRIAGNYYYQTAPAGDFSVVCKMIVTRTASVMVGPMILDSSGNGVGMCGYSAPDAGTLAGITAGVYPGTGAVNDGIIVNAEAAAGMILWYKLTKVGTTYTGYLSTNGVMWRSSPPTKTFATTPTRIGFGAFLATPRQIGIDFFDVQ